MVSLAPGHELRVLMAIRNVRARQAAEKAGLTEWQLSRIINGRAQADPAVIARIRSAIFTTEETA